MKYLGIISVSLACAGPLFATSVQPFAGVTVVQQSVVTVKLSLIHILVVCANAKPFQLVFFTCLSCQEDNGDMGVAYVILDG